MLFVAIVPVGLAIFHFADSSNHHHSTPSSSSSSAVAKAPTDLLSGLSTLLTDIRSRFGDTMGYDLQVRQDNVSLSRADPTNNGHQKLYSFYDGSWHDVDTNPVPAPGEALADLGKFDVVGVTAALKSAPQTLHLPAGEKVYLVVQGQPDGSLALRIFDDGTGDNDMEINPDGSVKEVHLH